MDSITPITGSISKPAPAVVTLDSEGFSTPYTLFTSPKLEYLTELLSLPSHSKRKQPILIRNSDYDFSNSNLGSKRKSKVAKIVTTADVCSNIISKSNFALFWRMISSE